MMSNTTVGHGINVDKLVTISELGGEIATFCNETKFIAEKVCPQKTTLTRRAAVSEVPMIAFGQCGDTEWGFGVQIGNLDRLWFCRNVDSADTVYYFEDSIYPQDCSAQEYARLIDYLAAFLRGLTMP